MLIMRWSYRIDCMANMVRPPVPVANNRPAKIGLDSSQDGSEDDEEEEAMTPQVAEPPQHFHQKMSKEEEERIKAEQDEEDRKQKLQLYVFVTRCISYHFNAKQPTDMARRQLKVNKQELAKIKDRFQSFLKGETQIAADEAFTKAIDSYFEVFLKSERVQKVVQAGGFSAHDFREVFRCNVEKRIRSLPEIDGLSKDTVLNSWMTKFDTIFRGEEENAQSRSVRTRIRGSQQANADLILGKDQLYDMFQQILGVKKFEHQIIFNALQLENPDEQAAAIRREVATREETVKNMSRDRKMMPKFVVKDMETLYIDEVRSSINLLISNLESVPVTPKGSGGGGSRKTKERSRSRSRSIEDLSLFNSLKRRTSSGSLNKTDSEDGDCALTKNDVVLTFNMEGCARALDNPPFYGNELSPRQKAAKWGGGADRRPRPANANKYNVRTVRDQRRQ
uniref:Calcium-dependent secretion activator n=1 Tax=Plectus sambesii TaxID=2011161 RepID=A0A914WLD6_9BILA